MTATSTPSPVASAFEIAGRRVLVTGAANGIGAVLVRRFAEAGARVAALDLNPAEGDVAEAAALVLTGDVTREDDVAAAIGACFDQLGGLDAVVNNAGLQDVAGFLELGKDRWDAMLATNVTGIFHTTQHAARRMAEAGGGAIVNIASIEGDVPMPMHAHYNASKAAVLNLTRACALELGPLGVRVNAISPGIVRRPGIEQQWPEGIERWDAAAPLGRIVDPEDVADAARFLICDASRSITGENVRVDAGVLTNQVW